MIELEGGVDILSQFNTTLLLMVDQISTQTKRRIKNFNTEQKKIIYRKVTGQSALNVMSIASFLKK